MIKAGLLVALNLQSITGQSFAYTDNLFNTGIIDSSIDLYNIYEVILLDELKSDKCIAKLNELKCSAY